MSTNKETPTKWYRDRIIQSGLIAGGLAIIGNIIVYLLGNRPILVTIPKIIPIFVFLSTVSADTTESGTWLLVIVHSLQFLAIGLLLISLLRRRKEKKLISNPEVKQFLNYWIAIWLLCFVLYFEKLVIQVLSYYDILKPEGISAYIINALIANSVPALFFLIFLILDVPSLSPHDVPFRRYGKRILLLLLAVDLTAVSYLLVPQMREISDWIGSVWAGLAIAFLAGKLDSKIIKAPRGYVAITYFYALIQILAPFLDRAYDYAKAMPIWFNPVVFSLALLGKFALFLIVIDLLDRKKIEKYLSFLRKSYPPQESELQTVLTQ